MEELATLNRRLSLLKNSLPPKGIKLKCESPAWSEVQGTLSRGDIKLAQVLANIEEVSLSGWRKATKECHLDIDFYLHQRWDTREKLPWSILDSGTEPGYLELELNRAFG
jgi:hypothetical protein